MKAREIKKEDNLDPLHWFVVQRRGDEFVVRNFTMSQDLLGLYSTEAAARKVIRNLYRQNKRFVSDKPGPASIETKELFA